MEIRGLELRSACSCEPVKQSRPIIPLLKPPVCLQLRDEVGVKTPHTLEVHAISTIVPHLFYLKVSFKQILKFALRNNTM